MEPAMSKLKVDGGDREHADKMTQKSLTSGYTYTRRPVRDITKEFTEASSGAYTMFFLHDLLCKQDPIIPITYLDLRYRPPSSRLSSFAPRPFASNDHLGPLLTLTSPTTRPTCQR